jgi:hypothetical protein
MSRHDGDDGGGVCCSGMWTVAIERSGFQVAQLKHLKSGAGIIETEIIKRKFVEDIHTLKEKIEACRNNLLHHVQKNVRRYNT